MGKRIDWYDDPAAPAVTSVVPSAAAFIEHEGRVLLIRRDDNGNWSMPGGAMDPGESLTRCALREAEEESGVVVKAVGLAGIYTDPLHRIEYTSNGEVRQEFTVVYRCAYVSGEPRTSKESTSVRWVPRDEVLGLTMDRSQRVRLQDALSGRQGVRIDPA